MEIKQEAGCVLVFGVMPLSEFSDLIGTYEKPGWVLDTDLSRMAGASMAFGLPVDCERLKAQYAEKEKRRVFRDCRYQDLSDAAKDWLATGQQGRSSAAMFYFCTGITPDGMTDENDKLAYPHDPSDLARCRLLVEQVPEVAEHFQRMGDLLGVYRLQMLAGAGDSQNAEHARFVQRIADVSLIWNAIIKAWDALCATMDAEAPDWRNGKGRAEKTYAMMKSIAWCEPIAGGDPLAGCESF